MSDADDLVAQTFGGGIHRQDPSGRERIARLAVGEHDVLARRELAAVVEAHRAAHQEGLADRDAAVEEGLPRPDAFQDAAVVAQHRVEDPEPAPGRHDALRHHPADAGDLLADLGPGQRRHRGGVDVAVGEVPQEVAGGADAEPLELLRPALADALEELDGHVQSEGAGCAVGAAGRDFGMLSLGHCAAVHAGRRHEGHEKQMVGAVSFV